MSKPLKEENLEAWIDDYSKYISEESFKLLLNSTHGKVKGVSELLLSRFVARIVGMTIYEALKRAPEGAKNKDEAFEQAAEAFKKSKIRMQEAVSLGFQSAFKTYANRDIEYYCTIKPVPEPLTKTVN